MVLCCRHGCLCVKKCLNWRPGAPIRYNAGMSLPVPTSDALAASHALQHLIAADIERHSGAISFARYMELALYAPGLGYYSGGAAKLGKDGDFTTAPELTPLFGAALATVAAAIIAQSALPDSFDGVVIANEVLDAMPVQLISKHPDGWRELQVTVREGRFDYLEVPADAALQEQIARQIADHDSLPVGYVSEVHGVACGFMATLARMLGRGTANAAILLDYGFPAHEYYLGQRATGTLMCHYRHHSHPDPFYYPGLQDVTAHVDFTAMALAAQEAGAEVLAYLNQAGFLIGAGAGDLLLRTDPADAVRYLPQARALQKLLSPAEMGELFKVLVVGRNVTLPAAILDHDRSHRL
jgi:SAM-dependent MidA family methyltransferase